MWYAQRGEDKKLRSLFPDKHNGFYIDVGAYHSQVDSVTKHFYDDGWRGINIEPIPAFHEEIAKARPRDINLQMAMSDHSGQDELYYIHGTGLSTFEGKIAGGLAQPQERIIVPVDTLAWVCNGYVGSKEIDFLKIDVEGHEASVLRGMFFEWWRPRIMVIEATIPCTDIPSWDEWLPIVLGNSYKQIDFDGLNLWFEDDARN